MVFPPLSDIFCTLREDYEVVFLALEVDFGLGSFAASHDDVCVGIGVV